MMWDSMEQPGLTRRRFLSVTAALGSASLLPSMSAANSANFPSQRWRGIALGAPAEIRLYSPDSVHGEHTLTEARREIERLENIFSLYRPASILNRLNRKGAVIAPPADLVRLLSESHHISRQTDGAFDVSVQSLWLLYKQHFTAFPDSRTGPSDRQIAETLQATDYRAIAFDENRVKLTRANMALTFNGIAQGYITDRVVDLLKKNGFSNFVANIGEPRLVDSHPQGRPWIVGLKRPNHSAAEKKLHVVNRGIATSAPAATYFDRNRKFHHLLDTKTGRPGQAHTTLSVVADNATLADGLSTAFSMMSASQIAQCMQRFSGVDVYRCDDNGLWTSVG